MLELFVGTKFKVEVVDRHLLGEGAVAVASAHAAPHTAAACLIASFGSLVEVGVIVDSIALSKCSAGLLKSIVEAVELAV